MYASISAHMYASISAHMYASISAHMYASISAHMYASISAHMYASISAHINLCYLFIFLEFILFLIGCVLSSEGGVRGWGGEGVEETKSSKIAFCK